LIDAARGIRQLHDLTFSSIEKTSLLVTPETMNALAAPLTLDQDDKYIDVDCAGVINVHTNVTWHNVGVPYRFDTGVYIGAAVTVEPGTVFELTEGVVVQGTQAALNAVGTAEAPIRWTSSEATPAAADWGCLDFSNNKGANLAYNEFEYGGGCSYGDRQQVLLVEADGAATFKNLSFSHLPDAAIQKAFSCPAASELTQWCGFQYSDVKDTVVCGEVTSPCK
jgi:hypothetical protein